MCLPSGLFLNPVPVPRFGKINFFPALFFPPSLLRFRGSQGLRGAREKIPRVWMRPLMQNNQFLGREKRGGRGAESRTAPHHHQVPLWLNVSTLGKWVADRTIQAVPQFFFCLRRHFFCIFFAPQKKIQSICSQCLPWSAAPKIISWTTLR